ncbi:MAG TPA: hypothetical protein VK034_21125, partial [Enhygromyxa sp.]|nr:hypothetical protein [Enhygromyxa sp.]
SARAERSRAGLEHYRNDTSLDALRILAPFCERFGLTEVEHRAVGPSTSNQWLLRLCAAAQG